MMYEKFKSMVNLWELEEEIVLAEKIQLGNREIYPLHKISVLYKKSGEVASASVNPILWMILENNEKYILLFDEEEVDADDENIFDFFDMIPEKPDK
jgi:hypothetical protein